MWNWSYSKLCLGYTNQLIGMRFLSNNSAYVNKVRRSKFCKLYDTVIVKPDGSTYNIRYFEPRRIIRLPLDIWSLSEEERNEIIERRKPKKKVVIEKEIEDNFDSRQYIKLIKKTRS